MTNSICIAGNCASAERATASDPSAKIPEVLCRRYIEKIAGGVTFCRAGQLRQLLRWLAERAIAIHPSPPSEKEIASEVLNRQDFDPQTDSLVRKEMSRLREKLTRYYQSEGLYDEIRVGAESGYLLDFRRTGSTRRGSGASCWLVLPFRTDAGMDEQSELLLEELLIILDELGGPELIASTTALSYRGRTGDLRQFAAECNADFVIEGRLRHRSDSFDATVWLVDAQTGRARCSRRVAGSDAADLARSTAAWLLESSAE